MLWSSVEFQPFVLKIILAAHDFKEAHELDPNDVKLKQDYEVLKARLSV